MVKYIKHNELLQAIVIPAAYSEAGIQFFTPSHYSQKLGYMKRPQGYVIEPHIHKHIERNITLTQEVLYIKTGKVKVDFYNEDRQFTESYILRKCDVILHASGGHGFEMLEDAEIIEIKKGPYAGDEDKVKFTS